MTKVKTKRAGRKKANLVAAPVELPEIDFLMVSAEEMQPAAPEPRPAPAANSVTAKPKARAKRQERRAGATQKREPADMPRVDSKRWPLADPTDADEANRLCVELDAAAAAWAAAVNAKVRELAEEMGCMDNILSNPERKGSAMVLRQVINGDSLGRLMRAIDEAEKATEDLLDPSVTEELPDLAGACRRCAAALGFGGGAK